MVDNGPFKGVDEKEEEDTAEFALSLEKGQTARANSVKGLQACFSAQPPSKLSDFLTQSLYCQ